MCDRIVQGCTVWDDCGGKEEKKKKEIALYYRDFKTDFVKIYFI